MQKRRKNKKQKAHTQTQITSNNKSIKETEELRCHNPNKIRDNVISLNKKGEKRRQRKAVSVQIRDYKLKERRVSGWLRWLSVQHLISDHLGLDLRSWFQAPCWAPRSAYLKINKQSEREKLKLSW